MTDEEDPSKKYFPEEMTDRERAVFEAGVALATAYHQFVGSPLPRGEGVRSLEESIERSIESQPFRSSVEVEINEEEPGLFDYSWLSPQALEVSVEIRYGGWLVVGRLRYLEDFDYPLMHIEDLREVDK